MKFTVANAKQFSAIGHEARRQLKLRRLAAEEEAKRNPPQPPPIAADETYDARRLYRVRAQLDRVDDMILHEDDPQRLDRLAAASARLSEQVRILSNKPLPGSYKPTGKPTKRQTPNDISPDLTA